MQTYVTLSVEIIIINAWNKNIIMTNKVNYITIRNVGKVGKTRRFAHIISKKYMLTV